MGKSSTYRKGPHWQGDYTPSTNKVSKGGGVHPEGTHMSGGEKQNPRKGAPSGGNKSKVSYSSAKVRVPTGMS